MCLCLNAYVMCACGGPRIICRNQFTSFIKWVPGIKPRPSNSVAGAFPM